MTPHEFNDALDVLGYSQCEFARTLGINDRTVRRWSAGDVAVPAPVIFTLKQMSILHRQGVMSYDEADKDDIVDETKSSMVLTVLEALIAEHSLDRVQSCLQAIADYEEDQK